MAFLNRWGCDRRLIIVVGMVIMLLASSATIGMGASERGIMLDVRDARLAEVVLLLTQQSGANITINPDVADKRVTAVMYDKPLDVVLEHVVKNTAGVDYWKTEDGTFIIGGKRPEPKIEDVQVESIPQLQQPVSEVRNEKLSLVNSDPYEMLIAMGLLLPEDNPNHNFLGLQDGGVLGILDEDKMQTGIHVPGAPRNFDRAGRVANDTVPPTIDPNAGLATSDAGRSATIGEGAPQAGYRAPTSGGTTGPGPAGSRTPPGGATAGTTGTGTLLPDGVELVQPFPLDNSIIVRGTDDGIAEFKELVHLLDIPPKQVSIKAEFIEVSTNDVKSLGIDWSLERLNETINTNFNPSGNVVVGVTTGNLAASLRAELTRGSGQIINSPIISTINNEFAQISIGSQIPYWTTTVISAGNGQIVSSPQVNYLTIQTFLNVLPRVNGDGTITLTLMPSVQDTGRIFKDPTGNQEIPETRFQTLYTRRRVMNGETIVVGGFIRKDQSTSTTQIPILGSLPIIGPLFRSSSTTTQDRELLIFVTPTIIGESSAGSSVGVSLYP